MPTLDKVPLNQMIYGIVMNDLPIDSLISGLSLSGWILRRADEREKNVCSYQLRRYSGFDSISQPRQEMQIFRDGNSISMNQLADSRDWRYLVISPTNDAKLTGSQLSEALRLSDVEIWVELWHVRKIPGVEGPEILTGGSPGHCIQYVRQASLEESKTAVDWNQLEEIVALRASFDDKRYPSIIKSIEMFRSLDVNPPTSIKMLGYFSIIERLLSHAPQSNDSADSITRQLKRNLILLNNRMPAVKGFGFNEFGQMKPEKVITKLYSYRSAIAHGGDEQSKLKDLLGQHTGLLDFPAELWPDRFLRRLVKRLLVHALREPQLIVDLKG